MIIDGPLATMETWETVKSVTLTNLLSQTPVNFFKLLTQVKDFRFKASWEGNLIGEIGQL